MTNGPPIQDRFNGTWTHDPWIKSPLLYHWAINLKRTIHCQTIGKWSVFGGVMCFWDWLALSIFEFHRTAHSWESLSQFINLGKREVSRRPSFLLSKRSFSTMLLEKQPIHQWFRHCNPLVLAVNPHKFPFSFFSLSGGLEPPTYGLTVRRSTIELGKISKKTTFFLNFQKELHSCSPPINGNEEEKPNNVHKVPIPSGSFKSFVVSNRKVPSSVSKKGSSESYGPNKHVKSVKSSSHIESRSINSIGNRERSYVIFKSLNSHKDSWTSKSQNQSKSHSFFVSCQNSFVSPSHSHSRS